MEGAHRPGSPVMYLDACTRSSGARHQRGKTRQAPAQGRRWAVRSVRLFPLRKLQGQISSTKREAEGNKSAPSHWGPSSLDPFCTPSVAQLNHCLVCFTPQGQKPTGRGHQSELRSLGTKARQGVSGNVHECFHENSSGVHQIHNTKMPLKIKKM